jgi:hypothetical protein
MAFICFTSQVFAVQSSLSADELRVSDNTLVFTNEKLGILNANPNASLDVGGSTIFRKIAMLQDEARVTGNGGGAIVIDWNNSNKYYLNISDANSYTVTFTDPILSDGSKNFSANLILLIEHSDTGDVSLPASLKWQSGIVPILTNTADRFDILYIYYYNGAYYATINKNLY